MQIHELNSFQGTPGSGDYLAIDDGTETMKVPATGVYPAMTQAEAEAGTVTAPRVIAPNIFKAAIAKLTLNVFYPVGSYYETSDSSFDPNTAWGGTWVKDSAGRVTVAQDTSQTEFDTIGETGGEKAHTLIANELPKIEGSFDIRPWQSGATSGATQLNPTGVFGRTTGSSQTGIQTSGAAASSFKTTMSFGNNQAHNNLQPYIVVNRWHRTA